MGILRLILICILCFSPLQSRAAPTLAINQHTQLSPDAVLDALHQYASSADWNNYFDLYLNKGVFIGTDASEHWDVTSFESYAKPTKGWRYMPTTRKLVRHNNVIVFDELLENQSYGLCRGTGTLIQTDNGWKIAQYHLSFPIPNGIAKSITKQINNYYKAGNKQN